MNFLRRQGTARQGMTLVVPNRAARLSLPSRASAPEVIRLGEIAQQGGHFTIGIALSG